MELPVAEQENPNTAEIDKVSTLEAARLINHEDETVAWLSRRCFPK